MLYAAAEETAIFDELAHIPAGYSYVRYFDYRLNPEHPPLVKAIAGLPLLAFRPAMPMDGLAWQGVNEQWEMGGAFLYRAGNDPDRIVRAARLGPILLALLLIAVVYLWSRRLFGAWFALLPAALLALSPTLLAHGHYVTTDVGAALGIVAAAWSFVRCLERPSWQRVLLAGLAFGAAQLLKFSAILLVPYFGILAGLWWYFHERTARALGKTLQTTVLTGAIGLLLVIYPMYALFSSGMPEERQSPETIMAPLLRGTPHPEGLAGAATSFAKAAAGNAATRPLGHWFLGLAMVFDRSAHGNTAYFMGEVSSNGSKAYFPLTYLMKETVPALIILAGALLAFCAAVFRRVRRGEAMKAAGEYARRNFHIVAMVVFAALYWATSIMSPLNIGVRHLMPALPFMYMAAAPFWKRWATSLPASKGDVFERAGALLRGLIRAWLRFSILAALLLWLLIGTLAASPHFLSYFNEAAGGARNGYRYATDSNYDWGQDMRALQRWAEEHPEAGTIAVDYFGGGEMRHYLAGRVEPWWSSRGNPREEGISWLAVSVNTLEGAIQPAITDFGRKPEDEYRWLVELKGKAPGIGGLPPPDDRAGTSIFLYRVR